MPVNHEAEVFYSHDELAQRFQVNQDDLIKVITENKFDLHNRDGDLYLKKEQMESLTGNILSSLGISYQYYEIPENLKNCTLPWAATLARMYQDKFTYPSSISPEQGDFLRTLVCNIAPKNIVEIGCFTGVSTVWLAAGLEQVGSEGTVTSVDLFNDIMPSLPNHRGYLTNPLEYAQQSIETAQLSHRVKFCQNNSREVGEKIDEFVDDSIDFLFIDGDHTIEGCSKDFLLFYPHVAVGGYIILHDIYPEFCDWEGPRYVIDKYIKNSPAFDLLELKTNPINYGIAVIRKFDKDRNIELKTKLRNSAIWQSIKGKPLGNFIKNTLPFK